MKVKKHVSDNVKPKDLIKEIVKGNEEYFNENKEHFSGLASGQKPDITLVTCCDSRIPADVFGVDSLNEVFAIRNIGNQFRNSEGSIKYSVLHLKTPLVIIMGHTGCGAVNAALGDYREEDDAIQKEVIGLTNAMRIAQSFGADKESDPILRNSMCSEINVDHQVRKVMSDYNIKPLIKNSTIHVIGMMFDIHSVYKVSPAHVHIININGVTDTDQLKKHEILESLSEKEKYEVVRRLVDDR